MSPAWHRRQGLFTRTVYWLALACSWMDAGRPAGVGQPTLRVAVTTKAGVFDQLVNEALDGYDHIRCLDLSEVSVDSSQHKAPAAERHRPNPRPGQEGRKSSIASEAAGIPVEWAIDGANHHDIRLLRPTRDTVTAYLHDIAA